MGTGREAMTYEDAVRFAKARTQNNENMQFYIAEVQAKIEAVPPRPVEKYKVVKYVG